jgi:hypothetical protein
MVAIEPGLEQSALGNSDLLSRDIFFRKEARSQGCLIVHVSVPIASAANLKLSIMQTFQKKLFSLVALALLITCPLVGRAQQSPAQQSPAQQPAANGNQQIIAVATEKPVADFLPDKLAGSKATGDVKSVAIDHLGDLVGDQAAAIYREYYITRAASRQYGAARIDVFESAHPFGAFGLLTFYGGANHNDSIGAGSAHTDNALIFWKSNYFVRVTAANGQATRAQLDGYTGLAKAVAGEISMSKPDARPVVFRSLPDAARAANPRYFLGPESLNTDINGSRDIYAFNGDAEAVVAEYALKPAAAEKSATPSAASSQATTSQTSTTPAADTMKLAIIEYNTPQFAYDAIGRANSYIKSLPEADQQRIIIKREGNYIIEAVNFNDRQAAQSVVDAVQYPYGVQWLHHPLLPSPDPFREQKAAQMLISTFGLLGILLGSVLVCGSIFGTTMFLKRRKRMQAAFSDAGEMLRLDLDPFEKTILGLPPKRD